LQVRQLRLQTGLVLGHHVSEQHPLCGRHRLGPGVELPALEPRELEVELVDLDPRQRDLALAAGQFLRIGLGLLLQPLDQCGHLGRQACQIDGGGSFNRHAQHGAAPATAAPLALAMSTARGSSCRWISSGGWWPVRPVAARAGPAPAPRTAGC